MWVDSYCAQPHRSALLLPKRCHMLVSLLGLPLCCWFVPSILIISHQHLAERLMFFSVCHQAVCMHTRYLTISMAGRPDALGHHPPLASSLIMVPFSFSFPSSHDINDLTVLLLLYAGCDSLFVPVAGLVLFNAMYCDPWMCWISFWTIATPFFMAHWEEYP